MKDLIKNWITKNYKTILFLAVGLFILYWLVYVITPKVGMSEIDKYKIDLINQKIDDINKDQKKLDSSIAEYNKGIKIIDNNIENLKNQKIKVKEIYHEKIISIDTFNSKQLDKFFSDRYGIK
jgi:F0F1-type ATP synthase membrane subunit b/b'